MTYQEIIRDIDPAINPVGVEAAMRLQYSTLDHLSPRGPSPRRSRSAHCV